MAPKKQPARFSGEMFALRNLMRDMRDGISRSRTRLPRVRDDAVLKNTGGWIQDAIKKPGALRKSLGVKKGQTIPKKKLQAAVKKGGTTGKRAQLAMNLGKMRKKT